MRGLARWCMAHRRRVVVAWVAVAIVTTVLAQAVGPKYVTVFSLPGTQSQRASDLLKREFQAQSGDVDTIVFHVSSGTIDSPAVRGGDRRRCSRSVSKLPHVAGVVSPYSAGGSRPGLLATGRPRSRRSTTTSPPTCCRPTPASRCSTAVKAVHVPGLQVAAGGQVIEQAEGFSVGPATAVGVIAALVILLITFGSLAAAGMPLVTAGLGSDHRASR